MKIKTDMIVKLNPKAIAEVTKATKKGLLDVIVAIANDAIKLSPWLTGNNARSIMFEVGPGKEVAKGELEGAVYSTSEYGGYLETGTVKMPARPYLKPALDLHIKELPKNVKANIQRM